MSDVKLPLRTGANPYNGKQNYIFDANGVQVGFLDSGIAELATQATNEHTDLADNYGTLEEIALRMANAIDALEEACRSGDLETVGAAKYRCLEASGELRTFLDEMEAADAR